MLASENLFFEQDFANRKFTARGMSSNLMQDVRGQTQDMCAERTLLAMSKLKYCAALQCKKKRKEIWKRW